MKIQGVSTLSFFTVLLLCLLLLRVQAEPNYNNLSTQYNDGAGMTMVFAKERLIDATTGFGAAYGFSGRVIHQMPKAVDVSFYGYHDKVQWQDIKTLTLSYNGQTFTNKVLHSLHGNDRDKSDDLTEGKYLEGILIELPLNIAKQVFNSSSVTVTSPASDFTFQLSEEQMDRCRDLIGTLPAEASLLVPVHLPDMKSLATSENGLPVTRQITESSSDAVLTMPLVTLTPRFGMSGLAF